MHAPISTQYFPHHGLVLVDKKHKAMLGFWSRAASSAELGLGWDPLASWLHQWSGEGQMVLGEGDCQRNTMLVIVVTSQEKGIEQGAGLWEIVEGKLAG